MADAAAKDSEQVRTQRTRDRGKPDGLFRACMDQIHVDHSIGQTLRNAMLAAGLMTDQRCYAELLAQVNRERWRRGWPRLAAQTRGAPGIV